MLVSTPCVPIGRGTILGLRHPAGQAAKADATRAEGVRPKCCPLARRNQATPSCVRHVPRRGEMRAGVCAKIMLKSSDRAGWRTFQFDQKGSALGVMTSKWWSASRCMARSPPKRSVAMAAVTADAGNLGRALIEAGRCWSGEPRPSNCRPATAMLIRRVDRHIDVDEVSGEMAVAAVAGTIVAGRYDVRTDQARR